MKLSNYSNHCAAAILAAAFVLLLGAALPLAAQTATRDPLVQPFAVDSIWNMPIGTGAQYVAINMPGDPRNDVWAPMPQIDDEYIFLDSTAPLTNINYSNAAWSGIDRCPATGGLLVQAAVPPGACSFRRRFRRIMWCPTVWATTQPHFSCPTTELSSKPSP